MADNQILGGLLLGLGRGIEGLGDSRREREDRRRDKQLFDLQKREAELDLAISQNNLEISRFRFQQTQGDADLRRQVLEAELKTKEATASLRELEVESADPGRVSFLRGLQDASVQRKANKEIREAAKKPFDEMKALIEKSQLGMNAIRHDNPDAVQRLDDFMGMAFSEFRFLDQEEVLAMLNHDIQTMGRDTAGRLGFVTEDSLNNVWGLREINNRIVRDREAITAQLAVIEGNLEALKERQQFVLSERDRPGLSAEQVAALNGEDALISEQLEQQLDAESALRNSLGGTIPGQSITERESDQLATGQTSGQGIGASSIPRIGPRLPSELDSGFDPVTNLFSLGKRISQTATQGVPNDTAAFLADHARRADGVISETDLDVLSGIRQFGTHTGASLEIALTQGASVEEIAAYGKNSVYDPVRGRYVLPSKDGFDFELDDERKGRALALLSPEAQAQLGELDDASRRAALVAIAADAGFGHESLGPLAGSPNVKGGAPLKMFGDLLNIPTGSPLNLSWFELAVNRIPGGRQARAAGSIAQSAIPVLRQIALAGKKMIQGPVGSELVRFKPPEEEEAAKDMADALQGGSAAAAGQPLSIQFPVPPLPAR